jgi:hypothetical protein
MGFPQKAAFRAIFLVSGQRAGLCDKTLIFVLRVKGAIICL